MESRRVLPVDQWQVNLSSIKVEVDQGADESSNAGTEICQSHSNNPVLAFYRNAMKEKKLELQAKEDEIVQLSQRVKTLEEEVELRQANLQQMKHELEIANKRNRIAEWKVKKYIKLSRQINTSTVVTLNMSIQTENLTTAQPEVQSQPPEQLSSPRVTSTSFIENGSFEIPNVENATVSPPPSQAPIPHSRFKESHSWFKGRHLQHRKQNVPNYIATFSRPIGKLSRVTQRIPRQPLRYGLNQSSSFSSSDSEEDDEEEWLPKSPTTYCKRGGPVTRSRSRNRASPLSRSSTQRCPFNQMN